MSETTIATAEVIDLPVLGMTCAACVRRVERAASATPGVLRAEVNLPLSRARLVIDPAITTVAAAAAAIRDAGYDVPADVVEGYGKAGSGAARLEAIARAEDAEQRTLERDAALAIVLTVPLLAIAMAHGLVESTASVVAQLVLGTIVVLVPGRHYLRRGAIAVRHRSPDMNTLIALGAGTAWVWSTIVAVRWLAGTEHHHMPALYFEAGAAIVAFVMIGKLLESRARARLSQAVRGLLSLVPESSVAAGDTVTVRPGERIPGDGTVVEGRSAVDEAMLTGESLPVDKNEGSPVYAGSLNHQGALTIRIARAGADTALARIARAVEDAQAGKAPIARMADRVAAVFVPVVLAIALATFGIWLAIDGTTVALERMIAVLVIACPCALGLATPAAVAVGTSRGAELGVLFRSGAALEIASRIDTVFLDKTGTLTTGKPVLIGAPSDEVLRLAASLEQQSEHPIARAIVEGARARGLVLDTPLEVVADPGGGVAGRVGTHALRIGTRDFIATGGVTMPAQRSAHSVAEVAIDGTYAGAIEVADTARPDAAAIVAALRAIGIAPVMLTGDRAEAAEVIAVAVGITEVHAAVRPTGKAAVISARRSQGHHVAMVGDGINDAPALAAADLGIALGSGTDIAAAASDVTLLRGGLSLLPAAFALARATLHTIRRNLIAAFAYNLVCIPVAAGVLYPLTGWQLSPVIASAAMSLSSVSVLLSSLRLRGFTPPS